MTEDMQAAWLEIEQMLGEATREEFDVFLRTWQRAVQATRKTLAQPDFWEGYVPEPVKPAQREPVVVFREIKVGEYVLRFWPSDNGWMCGITSEMMQALTEQSAQQALDKKAENARELGLDYEPAQQEPVAWMSPHGGMLTANYINNFASGLDKEIHNIPLYTFQMLERFAELVRADEREACHALRQTLPNPYDHCQVSAHAHDMAIAAYGAAIRARSKNEDRN